MSIAIDGRVEPGAAGGIAQAVLGLVYALGRLDDGPERYAVVVHGEAGVAFLEPHLGPNQRLIVGGPAVDGLTSRALARGRRVLRTPGPLAAARSNGFYESLGVHVVHFPHQAFVESKLPAVYNPHDLQHLHYPDFFSPETLAWRESVYERACNLAHTVVVASQWIKDDLIDQYSLDPGKVQIVPWGPPTSAYELPDERAFEEFLVRNQVQRPFLLYPAVTWPHKNHIALLEAIAALRDRDIDVQLVCTGSLDAGHWPAVADRSRELRLDSLVKFLGFVSDGELRGLYRSATALVLPTLHESDSFPIFEAWLDDLPVACSNVTSLPEQVQDAALVFDPTPDGIEAAVLRMWTDAPLRDSLRERGRRRLTDFSWERTARAYRAVYRRAAGYALEADDRDLLAWNWMREPAKLPLPN